MRRRDVLALGLSSLTFPVLGTRGASAQASYPEQPIRFIVPRVRRRRCRCRVPLLGRPGAGCRSATSSSRTGRRRWRHRGGSRRACEAGRPHAARRHDQRTGHQPGHHEHCRLRSGQGSGSDRADRGVGVGADGAWLRTGQDAQGTRGLRQGQSWQAVVRLRRRRHLGASVRRAVQADRRSAGHRACAVQGCQSGTHRLLQRPPADVCRPASNPTILQTAPQRQDPHAGGRQQPEARKRARHSDQCRRPASPSSSP